MKRIRNIIIGIIVVCGLSSCGDIQEEMWLEKDGSGKLEYTIDLSEALPMLQMMMAMDTTQDAGGGDIVGKLFEEMGTDDIDSTMNFYEVAPDSIKDGSGNLTLEEVEDLKKIDMTVKANKASEQMLIKIGVDFTSFAEIDRLFSLMDKSDGGDENMAMMGEMFGDNDFGENYLFDSKGFTKSAGEEDAELGDMMDDASEEDMGMMEMMFGESKYVSIYHFPYKVKSAEGTNVKIDGNTVVSKVPFMEMMEDQQKAALSVKFKKKFLGIFEE